MSSAFNHFILICSAATVSGLLTAPVTLAGPAHADTGLDAFLAAIGHAGGAPTTAAASRGFGQSVCAAAAQPGHSLASIASNVTNRDGVSPKMATFVTGLAISMYCPTLITSLAGDNWLKMVGNNPY